MELEARNTLIAQRRAEGLSFAKIGKEVGLSAGRIQQICEQKDVRELIEDEMLNILHLLPEARKTYEVNIKAGSHEGALLEDRRLAKDCAKDIMQSAGILPGNAPIQITKITNNNTTNVQAIVGVIAKAFIDKLETVKAIEAEVINGDVG
jgi:hypothetical protein